MLRKFTKKRELLTAAMLLCFCAFTNKVIGQTWNIGNPGYNSNVTATLSGNTLTISGNGNMVDFWNSTEGEAPWWFNTTNRNAIQTVAIQSGVLNIGNRAFKDCSNLRAITIPNTVTIIGRQAFFNCSNANFQSITIPNGVTEIEGEAFKNCTGLKTVTIDEGEEFSNLKFSCYDADPSSSVDNKYSWFENCPIQTLNLKRQYTNADGRPLFSGNNYLQTLTIGRNVTALSSFAFADCGGLTNVTLQDGSSTLGFGNYGQQNSAATVFSGCPINTLYLGRNIEDKDGYSGFMSPFYNKTTLITLTVGNNISIATYAFQNCINLQTANIGNDVISVESYAFDGCGRLSNLTIGNSVTSIGDAAFRNCSALTGISIPESVTSFGRFAFSGSGLKNITIPAKINIVGNSAFADCGSLTNVILQDGSNTLGFGNYFEQNSAVAVFNGCPINTLYLGRNIEDKDGYSGFMSPFYNKTTLKTLTVGKNMTEIADYAFQGCNGLTQITNNNPAPPTFGANTFAGAPSNISLQAPCTLVYQNSAWGTKFINASWTQTGTCPNDASLYELKVLSSNTNQGHATSTGLSGAILTSTYSGNGFPSVTTTRQFSGRAVLMASAKANSVFLGWNDGNLESMRIVDVTANKSYTAQFASCSSSGVEGVRAASSILVYPNPTKDYITIELSENIVGTLALFDLNGKIVINQSVDGNITTINTASLSVGTYILRLVEDGVASVGVKIVKE